MRRRFGLPRTDRVSSPNFRCTQIADIRVSHSGPRPRQSNAASSFRLAHRQPPTAPRGASRGIRLKLVIAQQLTTMVPISHQPWSLPMPFSFFSGSAPETSRNSEETRSQHVLRRAAFGFFLHTKRRANSVKQRANSVATLFARWMHWVCTGFARCLV